VVNTPIYKPQQQTATENQKGTDENPIGNNFGKLNSALASF
jgi:hypothetical protein